MKKKVLIGVAVLVVIAGVILGFGLFKGSKNNGIKYKKEALTKGDIEALVVTSGTLNPVSIVDVGSQVSGRIGKLSADFNSLVKEGQIVAEIDQALFITRVDQNEANYQSAVASLEKAKVNLDNAKNKYERALSLFEKNLISFEEKEQSEAQYLGAKTDVTSSEARVQQAKSQLDSSKVDLSQTIIRSPVDGIVISRNINMGQTVAASFQAPTLFKIATDLSKMQVECSVDEADIGKVKEGQKVRFTVEAFPQDTFSGTVRQVRYSPETVQNVVTYTTIVDVENPEMKLRPGMTATVSIITGEAKNALKVPNAALRFTPPLSPEEMEKLMKEVGEKMRAQRQQEGQPQSGNPPAGRTTASSQRVEGAPGGSGSTAQGMPQGFPQGRSGSRGGARMQASRVWIQDESGKLMPAFIRPGVTDNSYTEVLRGDLKEGQMVITGLDSGTGSAGAQRTQDVRRNVMFIGR